PPMNPGYRGPGRPQGAPATGQHPQMPQAQMPGPPALAGPMGMSPGQPSGATVGGAFARSKPFGGLFSGLLGGSKTRSKAEEFKPTPAPERLADVLEPRGRRLSRGLFVGVITGSLALGALAALAWRMMGK
ncbi:MAG TPA: hypothetical protein VGG33_02965, partial [Polyangia bacterium]